MYKGILILGLLAGLIISFTTLLSFARDPIRNIIGTVIKVSDGDTIQVTTTEQTKLRVHLYGIDTPEMPKTNPPPDYVRLHSQNHLGRTARKPWKSKSWGKKSDWMSWTSINTSERLESFGWGAGISTWK